MQAAWPVGLGQREEAMAPAKTGVAMDIYLQGSLAHRKRVEQAVGVGQPAFLVVQMRQRRTAQGIEGFAAGYTAIALQAVGLAMAVEVCR